MGKRESGPAGRELFITIITNTTPPFYKFVANITIFREKRQQKYLINRENLENIGPDTM